MKKNYFIFLMLFLLSNFYGQELDSYYFEVKEGYELGDIQKTTKTDGTLTLSFSNTALANALNSKPIYSFEKAFPKSKNPRLQRVYILTTPQNTSFDSLLTRTEVNLISLIDENVVLLSSNSNADYDILPDDYEDIMYSGRNTSLDLIRAPQAWRITIGNEDVVIGVVDAKLDSNHEDLQGQILENLNIGVYNSYHGTAVTGFIGAKTNNNKGISSIAHGCKIVFVGTNGGLNQLVQGLVEMIDLKNTIYPNLKVINCSWSASDDFNLDYLDLVIHGEGGIIENDILIVASVGNGGTTLNYPASYDDVLGVTAVGFRFPVGQQELSPLSDWFHSWKDVFKTRPHIPNNNESTTFNNKVDISAPGHLLTSITDNYIDHPSGYRVIIPATSPAAPHATGVAALIRSVNPSLTYSEVKDIIKSTADNIYHIPMNQPYTGLIGTGRLNAYRAVMKAKCMVDPNFEPTLDLMIRNSLDDFGYEPDQNTGEELWESPDIWVRHNSNESYIDVHQNPEYDPQNPNYVYVRVTNRSCVTSSGSEQVKLSWAKANAGPMTWPQLWQGEIEADGIALGGEIGIAYIPSLEPGQEAIVEIPWLVPNPTLFQSISTDIWHFCLAAEIITTEDPSDFVTNFSIGPNVRNNNNLAWKNLNIIDVFPGTPSIGNATGIHNPTESTKYYNIEIVAANNALSLYQEAEISIELNPALYQAWENTGSQGSNFIQTHLNHIVLANYSSMVLENVELNAFEIGTLNFSVNFLTTQITDQKTYNYHVIQRDANTNEIVGGVSYEIRKQPRQAFLASAGSNKEIEPYESTTLEAGIVGEDATYNWYDSEGNQIHTGTDFTVSPDVTKKYKLEVISNLDGLKDYAEVEVKVNKFKIVSIVPNPATTQVTIDYTTSNTTSAYLMLVNQSNASIDSYILDQNQQQITIDVNGMFPGFYSVVLVCNGEIQNIKTLLIQ